MRKLIIVSALLGLSVCQAVAAPQNPQRVSLGFPFPVYVNNTGTNQTMTSQSVYVNQTQYNPAPPSTTKQLLFRPTP